MHQTQLFCKHSLISALHSCFDMLLFFLGFGGIKASPCLPLGALSITTSVSLDELSFASDDVCKPGLRGCVSVFGHKTACVFALVLLSFW